MSHELSKKIIDQIVEKRLPTGGHYPFKPRIEKNRRGEPTIVRRRVGKGPKAGEVGFVDDQDRIWIKDRAHADIPDHWDVQIDNGDDYFRVGLDGNEIA